MNKINPFKCQLLIGKHKVGVIFMKVDKSLCVALYIHMMHIVEYTNKCENIIDFEKSP
jgi:hypothetical protein